MTDGISTQMAYTSCAVCMSMSTNKHIPSVWENVTQAWHAMSDGNEDVLVVQVSSSTQPQSCSPNINSQMSCVTVSNIELDGKVISEHLVTQIDHDRVHTFNTNIQLHDSVSYTVSLWFTARNVHTVPRSTQPSTLRGMVNEYQLSGWVIIIHGDGGCRR